MDPPAEENHPCGQLQKFALQRPRVIITVVCGLLTGEETAGGETEVVDEDGEGTSGAGQRAGGGAGLLHGQTTCQSRCIVVETRCYALVVCS